ncbi:DNA replication protein SLD5 Ecym_3584 [Eremothecium cymbalariae DBVPG|uniref:DNA replication complex GINS protein SLD5 n=1 Tax=Eremothecium cymbalariae (strain CBS 270.75 / DBVPG 7215 / KCTC 17166 / NRRL Y-17582) TaxID=931890 RepID=G8JQR7_ERECY|nr:Hypothetical protein Ecym_3584 [Eremothecium cymbalariae DBVPG\
MDINIEDILADLDRDTTAIDSGSAYLSSEHDTTRFSESNGDHKDVDRQVEVQKTSSHKTISAAADYECLVTHWRNERVAPELLAFPHLLMDRILHRLNNQIEHLENLSMGFLEHNFDKESKLPLLCMEAEVERLKFVVRSYVRCRLHKIDKFSLYLRQINQDRSNLESLNDLLSRQEMIYHERHSEILLKLFNNSILKHMPQELQAIDDTEGSVNMIDAPNWGKFVFLFVRGSPEGSSDPLQETNEDGQACYLVTIPELNEEVELTIGGIYVMRYHIIKHLLREDKVVLI